LSLFVKMQQNRQRVPPQRDTIDGGTNRVERVESAVGLLQAFSPGQFDRSRSFRRGAWWPYAVEEAKAVRSAANCRST
jgi:hypothetical protein